MIAYTSSLFAGVAVLAIAGAAQAQAPAEIPFSVPAGPLGAALNTYASQAGRQLMFTSDQVAGRRTGGVSGRMTADAALDRLLAGSGLVAVRSSSGAWVLQHAAQPQLSETTTLEEVVVTGSLLRGPGETPSPVTVIRRDDLDRTGRSTVADALAALPQNYAGSGTPTAALVGSDPMQSNPGLATGVNLRGLGPDSTLVLVNGRRMAGAGGRGDFADVSAVPTAAVERVDVLLDGASALYGADAVGGVVNIILRRDFDGQESRLRLGASEGGAESIIAAHTIGKTWTGGQVLLSYEFERQNPLSASDRDYTATGDLRPFGGTDHRTIYGAPGNLVRFDSASGAYVVTHAIRPGATGVARTPADFAAGQQNFGNTRVGGSLVPEFDRHAVYLYGRQALGGHLELTGDLRFSQREFETDSLTPTVLTTVTTANPHFVSPTGATSHSVAYSFAEDLGASQRFGRARSLGASLGARAFLPGDWEVEAYLTFGTERADDQRRGMLHSTRLQEALGAVADNPATTFSAARDGYLNLFGTGDANSRAVLDFISSGWTHYVDESEVASANVIAQGTAMHLPGGDLQIAVGAQFRTESLRNSGETFTSGLAPTLSQAPDKDREVAAAFVEVRAPLVGPDNALPGVRRLELSVAARIEDYDDIGSTANPKVGLIWVPVEDLRVRANWGTSFRAPAMTELAERRYISATFVADQVGQQVALFEGGGNPDLAPETADTFTLGFDYRPKDQPFRFGATWFDIAFSDQIGRPALDNLTQVLLDPSLAPFVRRVDRTTAADRAAVDALINSPDFLLPGVLPADAFGVIVDARWRNTASVEVRGIDGYAAYDLDLAGGALTLEANGSYMVDYRRRITSAAPSVDLVDTYGFPVAFRGTMASRWTRDDLSLRIAVNHVGGYRDFQNARIGSWTTADAQLGWTPAAAWGDGLSLTASIRNLFDRSPPFYDAVSGIGFDAGQADPLGRTFSLQLTRRW
ncbi:TonB-dependent receptor [uncultured Brevundimonas sp.]|uniref:TonB-dependent receptor n=1 Tax=uncultured Brevundimonas sp. TaxID=213418 RepID=UPI0025FC2223|nr:TonB-dependent receptor [uncultured Brevundimonas sp.]